MMRRSPRRVALVLEPPNASSQAEAERMREQLNRPERDVSPPGLPTTQEMFRRWAAIQVAAIKVLEVLGANDGVALFTTCGELRQPLTNDLTVIRENIRELAATIQICPSGHFLDRDELIAISSYLRQASSGRSQLTIYPIGIEKVPRRWASSHLGGGSRYVPFDGKIECLLIENPIEIRAAQRNGPCRP